MPETPGDVLVRAGRKERKTGGGWYDYAPGARIGTASPEVARLLALMLGDAVALSGDANTDPSLYDVIGRRFFVGARVKF